ncbi:hypothetical protein ACFQ3W_25900 [Paenibacillus puldeungensis]|uniref:Uncharacterized protein n=2 Tax=Paenibacillus puldeungensis TaxID=696536 RepID=A0ABW3S4K2_9BACL
MNSTLTVSEPKMMILDGRIFELELDIREKMILVIYEFIAQTEHRAPTIHDINQYGGVKLQDADKLFFKALNEKWVNNL